MKSTQRPKRKKKALSDKLTKPSGASDEEALKRVATIVDRAVANGMAVSLPLTSDDAANGFEPTALIRHLATHAAWVSVYAALDPHRYRDDSALMRNVAQKREAGACGFFTQPLFDLHDIDRCSEALGEATTFWGLSPVVSDRSQRYWQQVNSVRFPSEFVPTLNWNQSFALRFLSEIADRGGNAYLMPIKVDIERYLAPLAARFA